MNAIAQNTLFFPYPVWRRIRQTCFRCRRTRERYANIFRLLPLLLSLLSTYSGSRERVLSHLPLFLYAVVILLLRMPDAYTHTQSQAHALVFTPSEASLWNVKYFTGRAVIFPSTPCEAAALETQPLARCETRRSKVDNVQAMRHRRPPYGERLTGTVNDEKGVWFRL